MTTSAPTKHCQLSVAMIVRDEPLRTFRTLKSVKSIADELVVVDTGSIDHTRDIAWRCGARVFDLAWTDDYSAARNHALQHATGNWILWLEPGEEMSAESAEALRAFVDTKANPGMAYLVFVELPATQPGASAEQVARIRLVPRHPALRFEGRVREHLRASIAAAGMSLEVAPGRVICPPRQHSPQVKARKAREELRLLDLEIRQRGPSARLLVSAGEMCDDLGEKDKAAEFFRQALDKAERGSLDMLEAYYGLLAAMDGGDHRLDQLTTCVESLEVFPVDAQLLCAMGSYLQNQNRFDLAERSYRAAVRHGQVNLETWHLVNIADVAASCLSLALQVQGKDDEARRELEEALTRSPSSVRLRRHLVDLHVKHAGRDEALAEVEKLPLEPSARESLENAVRGACLAAKENWIGAMAYLKTAYAAGCRDRLCMRWLAVSLLSSGQTRAADPILRQWRALEPQDVEPRKYLDALAAEGDDVPEKTELRQLRIDSAKHPLDAAVHFRLGEAYRQEGDCQAAEAVWREYLKRRPDSSEVVAALCELLLRTDRIAEALQLADSLGEEAGPFRVFMQGVAAWAEGDWEAGRERFLETREAGYDSPLVLDYLSTCLVEMHRYLEAEPVLQELLAKDPAHAGARQKLAYLLIETGREVDARTMLDESHQLHQGHPHTQPGRSRTSREVRR
ncbi:MAG: tetratricopeptide repeat protein [Pirellulales bacterium]